MPTQVSGFAALNSDDVFGFVMKWANPPHPIARQLDEYPGVDGLQAVRVGARGGKSEVEGAWVGPDLATVQAFEALALQYQQDGGFYTLVDPYGVTWQNVALDVYRPDGKLWYVTSAGGGVARKYQMTLLHLGSANGA